MNCKRLVNVCRTVTKVEFNVLCVLNQADVERPREVYKFFCSLGIEHIQYIPLSEFDTLENPLPFTVTPEQSGRFLVETFELWWPERRKVRIRYFDNIAEALAEQKPGNCIMHETCDSYVVVECVLPVSVRRKGRARKCGAHKCGRSEVGAQSPTC